MIFRIIHFSDLHSKNINPKNFDIDKISRAVATLPNANAYAVVVSGDIAFSGKKDEYGKIRNFFIKLLYDKKCFKRQNRYINFFYAPGNHDIDYDVNEVPATLEEFEKRFGKVVKLDSAQIEEVQNTYADAMKNFYDFSEDGHCKWCNPFINTKEVDFNGHRINFVMVNSAPFSLLGGQSVDKGNHCLTQLQLNAIKEAATGEVNILVMHHSLEWFSDETKRELRNILSNMYTTFLFGHEHDEIAESRSINYGGECLYFQANAMDDHSMRDNGFGVLDISYETGSVKAYSFVFDRDIYTKRPVADVNIRKICDSGVVQLEEFKKELEVDCYSITYDSYYCFPGLEYVTFDEKQNTIYSGPLVQTIN